VFRFFAIVLAAFSVAPACWGSEPNFNPSSERGVLVFESVRSVTVPNDTLNATLVAEMTGQDATRLARQVNQMVARAKELAGKEETLQLRTLNYSTQPNFESGRRTGWMVRQTVLLES
jgi:predicted secreted protein